MGWDDSDDDEDEWDADDLEARLAAQEREKIKQKRRDEGLSSESEREEEKPVEQSKPKPKPKPKPVPKPVEEVLSPEERKLRQRQMEEAQDMKLAGDLFAGFENVSTAEQERRDKVKKEEEERKKKEAAKQTVIVKDSFDDLVLKVQKDVEDLCSTCCEKLTKGKAKDGSHVFLTSLLKQLEGELSESQLSDLVKVLEAIAKEKKVQQCAVTSKENKANTKLSKNTKFNVAGEWEEIYGGGDGDEEWTQEEWDEWNKQQEGAPAASAAPAAAAAPAAHASPSSPNKPAAPASPSDPSKKGTKDEDDKDEPCLAKSRPKPMGVWGTK